MLASAAVAKAAKLVGGVGGGAHAAPPPPPPPPPLATTPALAAHRLTAHLATPVGAVASSPATGGAGSKFVAATAREGAGGAELEAAAAEVKTQLSSAAETGFGAMNRTFSNEV